MNYNMKTLIKDYWNKIYLLQWKIQIMSYITN